MKKAPKLTREQAAIIGLYTDVICGPVGDVTGLAEKLYGKSILTHEYPKLADQLRELVKPLFLEICQSQDQT